MKKDKLVGLIEFMIPMINTYLCKETKFQIVNTLPYKIFDDMNVIEYYHKVINFQNYLKNLSNFRTNELIDNLHRVVVINGRKNIDESTNSKC